MALLEVLRTSQLKIGEFLIPWGIIISTLGFLAAWFIVQLLEHLGWTRHIWQLPLFFVALAVFFGCIFGLAFAP